MNDLKKYGIDFPIRDPALKKSFIAYCEGQENNVSYLDCLAGELQSDINANLNVGWLTKEQAIILEQGVKNGIRF